jgi:hypothetical protein
MPPEGRDGFPQQPYQLRARTVQERRPGGPPGSEGACQFDGFKRNPWKALPYLVASSRFSRLYCGSRPLSGNDMTETTDKPLALRLKEALGDDYTIEGEIGVGWAWSSERGTNGCSAVLP